MSMWYAAWVELILKLTVWPTLTLIDVAKPCRVASPAPATSQSLWGSPAAVFSHAMAFTTGGPHGPAAEAPPALVIRGNATPKMINASRLAPVFSPVRILPPCAVLALLVTSIPRCALMSTFGRAGLHLLGGNENDQKRSRRCRRASGLSFGSPRSVKASFTPWPRDCILGDPGDMW